MTGRGLARPSVSHALAPLRLGQAEELPACDKFWFNRLYGNPTRAANVVDFYVLLKADRRQTPQLWPVCYKITFI